MRTVIKLTILWAALITCKAATADDWFCTEGSSYRTGTTLHACGIGLGKDEQQARTAAFDAAMAEFLQQGGQRDMVELEAKRTSCSYKNETWICYRMVDFYEKEMPEAVKRYVTSTKKIYIAPSDEQLPTGKILLSMSKKQVRQVMDKPTSVMTIGAFIWYQYEGARCGNNLICYVIFNGDTIDSFQNIAYDYLEDV
jgi:hypothetical protein